MWCNCGLHQGIKLGVGTSVHAISKLIALWSDYGYGHVVVEECLAHKNIGWFSCEWSGGGYLSDIDCLLSGPPLQR